MNEEPEIKTIPLEKVLTDSEFNKIFFGVFPDFNPFDSWHKVSLTSLMCAAIKFDRAKRKKDI